MTDHELLQMALDMLDDINQCSLPPTGIPLPAEIDHVMEALRARLAQPEPQETIAKWIKANTEHRQWYICPKCNYQAPRFKDEWQGLTGYEVNECAAGCHNGNSVQDAIRKAEAMLKEKNA